MTLEVSRLSLHGVQAETVRYRGRSAVRLVEVGTAAGSAHTAAVLVNSDFGDGVIEALIAGAPRPDAPQEQRGFVGIAFHVQSELSRFECFFLRPTNGRANDQLRRNHSVQYMAIPDFPWDRLRADAPGVYESYTDLVPGAWTPIRIVVSGAQAHLYVNGADQPCLVVNDLKLGTGRGQIALWIGAGSEAHFASLEAH